MHRVLGGRHRPDGGLAERSAGTRAAGRVGEKAVESHRRLPADPGSGHPGRPVRAGQDRHPRGHGPRPAPGRLDRLDDPRHRGLPQRGRLRPAGRDLHRRRPRPATGELSQGAQGLPAAGRPGLRGGPRADDLRQLGQPARHDQRDQGAVHRMDRCGALLRRVLLHRGQRRHPDRVGHGRQLVRAEAATARSGSSGRRARRAATTPSTSATAARNAGLDIIKEVSLGPNPRDLPGAPARPCATRGPRPSSTWATATRPSTSPGPSRRSTGTRPASWAPPSCSTRTPTSGPRAWRAGTASTSWGRTAANPNYDAMLERFEARFGRVSRNVVVALGYDTARAAMHGIANALHRRCPTEVKAGLEQIKWMPCTNGGPGLLHDLRRRTTTGATRATSSPSAS